MSIFVYKHDEFHAHHIAFNKIERMIEELDLTRETEVRTVYNYVGNFLKAFKIGENINIRSLHDSLFHDLQKFKK